MSTKLRTSDSLNEDLPKKNGSDRRFSPRVIHNKGFSSLDKYRLKIWVENSVYSMQEETNGHHFWQCSYKQDLRSKLQEILNSNNIKETKSASINIFWKTIFSF